MKYPKNNVGIEQLYLSSFQCVMETSCRGYASTVRPIDVNSLTDSMTDVLSLIKQQLYSHHHLQHTLKYLHTAHICRFNHIVGHLRTYTLAFLQ